MSTARWSVVARGPVALPTGFLLLGLAGCVSRPAGEAPLTAWPPNLSSALLEAVARAVEANGLPGAVVAAGDAAGERCVLACGNLQTAPTAVPMTAEAIFDLASVTKVVGTTTAIMLLVDDGLLRLDDPIARHLPEWSGREAEGIRLHHLLTHTSGLPAYLSPGPLQEKHGPAPNPDAVAAAIAGLRLKRAPGSGVEYSCLNAILAGRIAENVAGTTLHDLLTRRVFGPLGMTDTGWRLTREQLARLVPTGTTGRLDAAARLSAETGPGPFAEGLVHDPLARYYINAERCAGNAGLYATAADLSRFVRAILGGGELDGVRILQAATVELFTQLQTAPGLETRGYGWDVWNTYPFQPNAATPPGRQAVGHTGFTGTMIWIDKDSGLWAVILASRVHAGPNASVTSLRREVVRMIVEGRAVAPTAAASQVAARGG